MSDRATCFLDIENGGLRNTDDKPWEVAVVRREPDGTEKQHLMYVADFKPADADPKALEMTGFWQRHPAWGKDRVSAEAAMLLNEDVNISQAFEITVAVAVHQLIHDAVVVACNPAFDVPRLTAMLGRHGIPWTAHYRPVCATTLAAGRLRLTPPWNNTEIGEKLGVKRNAHGPAHTALADALYARDLYDAALALPPFPLPSAPEDLYPSQFKERVTAALVAADFSAADIDAVFEDLRGAA